MLRHIYYYSNGSTSHVQPKEEGENSNLIGNDNQMRTQSERKRLKAIAKHLETNEIKLELKCNGNSREKKTKTSETRRLTTSTVNDVTHTHTHTRAHHAMNECKIKEQSVKANTISSRFVSNVAPRPLTPPPPLPLPSTK